MGFPIPVRRHLYIESGPWQNTAWCHYNTIIFLQNSHNKHHIAHLCFKIWFTFCHCYHSAVCDTNIPDKLDHIITSLDCNRNILNSLAAGRTGCNFKNYIFNPVLLIDIFRSFDYALRWMPRHLTDEKSTLVQAMMAPNHYLTWCWPRSMWPYGIIRLQWGLRQYLYLEKTDVSFQFSTTVKLFLKCEMLPNHILSLTAISLSCSTLFSCFTLLAYFSRCIFFLMIVFNFLLAQLKMHSHWRALVSLTAKPLALKLPEW